MRAACPLPDPWPRSQARVKVFIAQDCISKSSAGSAFACHSSFYKLTFWNLPHCKAGGREPRLRQLPLPPLPEAGSCPQARWGAGGTGYPLGVWCPASRGGLGGVTCTCRLCGVWPRWACSWQLRGTRPHWLLGCSPHFQCSSDVPSYVFRMEAGRCREVLTVVLRGRLVPCPGDLGSAWRQGPCDQRAGREAAVASGGVNPLDLLQRLGVPSTMRDVPRCRGALVSPHKCALCTDLHTREDVHLITKQNEVGELRPSQQLVVSGRSQKPCGPGEAPVGGRHGFSVPGLQAGLSISKWPCVPASCQVSRVLSGEVPLSEGARASRLCFAAVCVWGVFLCRRFLGRLKAGSSSCTSQLEGTRAVSSTCTLGPQLHGRGASGWPGLECSQVFHAGLSPSQHSTPGDRDSSVSLCAHGGPGCPLPGGGWSPLRRPR